MVEHQTNTYTDEDDILYVGHDTGGPEQVQNVSFGSKTYLHSPELRILDVIGGQEKLGTYTSFSIRDDQQLEMLMLNCGNLDHVTSILRMCQKISISK